MNTLCPFCHKTQAYPLPMGGYYHPPLASNLSLTITAITIDHTTATPGFSGMIGFSSPAGDYCYGHTFESCPECGCMVPRGYHTEVACALLRGLVQGIASQPFVERKRPEVPQAFQDAFKDMEVL